MGIGGGIGEGLWKGVQKGGFHWVEATHGLRRGLGSVAAAQLWRRARVAEIGVAVVPRSRKSGETWGIPSRVWTLWEQPADEGVRRSMIRDGRLRQLRNRANFFMNPKTQSSTFFPPKSMRED